MLLLLATIARADCVPLDIQVAIEESYKLLWAEQYAPALARAIEARDALGCAEEVLYAPNLAVLHQVGATAAKKLGDTASAATWLNAGARLAPTSDWDQRLDTPDAWLAAQRALVSNGVIRARSDVMLDGRALRLGNDANVARGEHLVQWFDEQGLVHSQLVVVGEERLDVGPEPAKAPKAAGPKGARIALWAVGGALLGGAGAAYYVSNATHFSDAATSELTYNLAIVGLAAGAATMFVPAVVLTDGGAAVQVSGRF